MDRVNQKNLTLQGTFYNPEGPDFSSIRGFTSYSRVFTSATGKVLNDAYFTDYNFYWKLENERRHGRHKIDYPY